MTRFLFLSLLFVGLLTSCEGDGKTVVADVPETTTPSPAPTTPSGVRKPLEVKPVITSGSAGMLEGEWTSATDATVLWTFRDGNLTESLTGDNPQTLTGSFSINDDCTNGEGNGAKQEDGYLNLQNPTRCFYIVSLTKTEMALSYVGRGNTLRFIKK